MAEANKATVAKALGNAVKAEKMQAQEALEAAVAAMEKIVGSGKKELQWKLREALKQHEQVETGLNLKSSTKRENKSRESQEATEDAAEDTGPKAAYEAVKSLFKELGVSSEDDESRYTEAWRKSVVAEEAIFAATRQAQSLALWDLKVIAYPY